MSTDQATPDQAITKPEHDSRPRAGAEIATEEGKIVKYLVGGLLVAITWVCGLVGLGSNEITLLPAFIGTLIISWDLFIAAARELKLGRPTSSTLASLAILSAMAIGEYVTAGLLAWILLVADQVLRRTASGARRAIEDLISLTPDIARLVENGAEREVALEDVRVGMTVRVRPGENLPVDGEIVAGQSTINQASLTGESVPVEAQPGVAVYAGTTNVTGQIDLRVTSVGADTTIGKVTKLIDEAESERTPRQLLIEQVAAYYVPVAITVAALVWYFSSQSENPETVTEAAKRAITVLVVVCPSALLLSNPTAMVSAFATAARLGIMIKQPSELEAAANIDTVILDKTGTITTGVFAVSRLAPAEGVEGAELLQAAADSEQHSNHPLAKSILQTARSARIEPRTAVSAEEIHGKGVRVRLDDGEIASGRANWLLELNPRIRGAVEQVEAKIKGMTGVHVMAGGRYLGAVGLEDKLRPNAGEVVERLRTLGVRHIALFTGDRAEVAQRVGAAVQIENIQAECLPAEKHERLVAMIESGRRVLMVGDGVNDGPSLATADVGVAMGLSGSDIAANSAGVALMNDDLSRIPFLIELARRTRTVIAQNIVASILIAIIGLILAATGTLAIGAAAAYHFAGDIFVFGNSFRLIRYGEEFAESEHNAHDQPRRRNTEVPSVRSPGVARAAAT
jgi:heavy metal translocating P-type ATPase